MALPVGARLCVGLGVRGLSVTARTPNQSDLFQKPPRYFTCRRSRRISMGVIEDMLNALDRIEWWRELRGVPTRVAALEKKIADLEQIPVEWSGEYWGR